MKIEISQKQIDQLKSMDTSGSWFWHVYYKRKAQAGDPMIWTHQGREIAKATCCFIEPPGESKSTDGKAGNHWKYFVLPGSFAWIE